MCGAIAALNKSKLQISLYQLGRGMSYLILGAGSGALGHKFYLNLNQTENLAASLIILTLGALIIFWSNLGQWLSQQVWKLIPRGSQQKRHFLLGFANGFLPCHFLYGFLAMAAASGSWTAGVLILFTQWLGSSPYLFAFSLIGKKLILHLTQYPKLYKVIQFALFLALTLNLIGHHM
jgi:sulfite exporter TauE/SafE